MKAMERIKEIEGFGNIDWEEKDFLLKAFNVMREIAIKHITVMSSIDGSGILVDKEFEEIMKAKRGDQI